MSTDLDPVAGTARLTAAVRARESARPDRLFDDPFAGVLAGDSGRALLGSLGGDVPAISVRTRYFDDRLTAALGAGDPRQLVIVAAGMDTRAHRLSFAPGTTVYELDRPELLELKGGLLAGDVPRPRNVRVPVGVDLTAAAWTGALQDSGFRPEEPSCWLAEGLTQYLAEQDVHVLLDRITSLSAPGSHLFTDFVAGSLLRDPAARPMLDLLAGWGATWHYGTDDPAPLLTARGWRPEVSAFSAVGRALGRPSLPDTPGGHLVHAQR
ncbi:class I SAM-dependent methyltransferase [Streptomyces sp. NPDC001262]|uniref:class I SAM-dependent methyltransferase n=1 Tax=unclassified Streptomyces TaxID=2593676 RepID=UPI003677A153